MGTKESKSGDREDSGAPERPKGSVEKRLAAVTVSTKRQPPKFNPNFALPVDNSSAAIPDKPADVRGPAVIFRTMRHHEQPNPAVRKPEEPLQPPETPERVFIERLRPPDPDKMYDPFPTPDEYIAMKKKFEAPPPVTRLDGFFWNSDGRSPAKDAAHGHQGLVWYLYACWAEDRGAVIGPDAVWFTVCSEMARAVLSDPERFRPLFTSQNEQTHVQVVCQSPDDLPLGLLISALDRVIADREFRELVTGSHFPDSAAPGFSEAMAAAFAHAATPFFTYSTTRCSIPFFCVAGSREEWATLSRLVSALVRRLPPAGDSGKSTGFGDYLERAATIIEEIRYHAFCDQSNAKALRDAETFFSGCFWLSGCCGSGHVYYHSGWIKHLYWAPIGPHAKSEFWNLSDFPSHQGIVPWFQEESKRMFCTSTGLFFSTLSADGKFLIPRFGQLRFEIHDQETFDGLAQKKKKEEEAEAEKKH